MVEKYRRAVVVFARAPELGKVKTRLAADLGDGVALEIYELLVSRTLQMTRALDDCMRVVQFTPAGAREKMSRWLEDDLLLEAQCEGDLGERMACALERRFNSGCERVLLIGTDAPDLTAGILEQAFRRLDDNSVVVGPAVDGGYYLIGMCEPHPELFSGVPWSAGDTLSRTLEAARHAGLSVHLLPELADVDTADDWKRWSGRL